MKLGSVVLVTALVVAPPIAATCLLCTTAGQVRRCVSEFDRRIADVAPYAGAVVLLSVFKRVTAGPSLRISRALDWEITGALYAVEGRFVAHLQDAVPELAYPLLSALYVFGFPYLLAVPPVLYFLLPAREHLEELLVAYVSNHLVGVLCYTLFIAYGPRNWGPAGVEGVLYRLYPWTQELTAAVSSNTNVFPSLHTSLSVTALLFAWRTRGVYPRWFYLAAVVATGVVLSTMLLGIHWLSDVVAGVALGVGSVVVARRVVRGPDGTGGASPTDDRDAGSDVAD